MPLGFTGALPNLVIGLISAIIIVFSAEKVVEKMQSVAKSFDISEVVIAATIISIGTSLPEISVHVVGSFNILGNPGAMNQISGTVLGMNIGSDIVQQTLIMGSVVVLASVIAGRNKFIFTKKFLERNYIPMIAAHLLLLLFALNGVLTRLEGLIMVTVFAGYIYYLYSKRDEKILRSGDAAPSQRPWRDLGIGLAGMLLLVAFSDVFLSVTEKLIAETGISGSMIGVATIGLVSATPEFVTALSAVRKGAEGLSLGTLIGSNITNPLMGVGLGAAISGYSVPSPLIQWDLPVQIATAVLLVTYLWNRQRTGNLLAPIFSALGMNRTATKLEGMENGVLTALGGILLVLLYFGYLAVRAIYFGVDF